MWFNFFKEFILWLSDIDARLLLIVNGAHSPFFDSVMWYQWTLDMGTILCRACLSALPSYVLEACFDLFSHHRTDYLGG